MATLLPLTVSSQTASGKRAMARLTLATPGV
ncbi:hypothetical protein HRbin25_00954 [bacterium HR25]|nr:hypothetical protein HRbin25_00954 [bacterium HR25]